MSGATLNFVLSKPNEAADHIDELERRLWQSSENLKQAQARIEAMEAEVRRYASEAVIANTNVEKLKTALRLIVDYHAGGPQTASYIQGIALAALAEEDAGMPSDLGEEQDK